MFKKIRDFFTTKRLFYMCVGMLLIATLIELLMVIWLLLNYIPEAFEEYTLIKSFFLTTFGPYLLFDIEGIGVVMFPFLGLGVIGVIKGNFLKWFGLVYYAVFISSPYMLILIFLMSGEVWRLIGSIYCILLPLIYIQAIKLKNKLKSNEAVRKQADEKN